MSMKARHDVINAVRRHRLTKDITQSELAELLGVTRQTVLSIEKGKYTPSIGLALRLAEIFEVSVETLFQLHKESGDE
jgi:putative transcriptional regulator